MNLLELLTVALTSIRSNKLRSFLTTLGIVIGIAAVISVVAIGQGGRAMLMTEMEKVGTNIFIIYVNYREGETAAPDLQVNDIAVIKKLVPEVKYMAPVFYSQLRLRGNVGTKTLQVLGTSADYEHVRNLNIVRGRFITSEDEAVSRAVIVIQEDTAKELFGDENPIGQRIVIKNNSVMVIGIVKPDTSMMGFDSQQTAYLPLSSIRNVTGWNQIHQIYGSAVSKEEVALAMERCKTILQRRHNTSAEQYVFTSMEEEMQIANEITGIMSLVISFIAGISLLVGGIGVMNIMLVSVTERTREIGIRMALGAKRRDILVQFLFESIVLCLMGGLIGTILGYGGAFLIAKFAKWPPLVSGSTVLVAFIFSAAVGLFFGLYPANKAARLNPIEALRRE